MVPAIQWIREWIFYPLPSQSVDSWGDGKAGGKTFTLKLHQNFRVCRVEFELVRSEERARKKSMKHPQTVPPVPASSFACVEDKLVLARVWGIARFIIFFVPLGFWGTLGGKR